MDINITNYCSAGCEPFQSITQLEEREAFTKAKELSTKNDGTAFNRFGDDFSGYYPKRIRTEKWLYDRFVAIGGKPKTEHPLYFVLDESDYLNEWFGNGVITQLSLKFIDEEDVSFTYGDSMARMDHEDRKDPFMKSDLRQLVTQYKGDIELLKKEICTDFSYIEVQLWNHKYVSI